MKVEQNETGFKEVVVTLETQDEVDQLYALISCAQIWNNAEIARLIHTGLKPLHTDRYKEFWKCFVEVLNN